MIKSRQSNKLRPAILISVTGYYVLDIIYAQDNPEPGVGWQEFDWLSAGLNKKSEVRCYKFYPVERSDFVRRVGRLRKKDLEIISERCQSVFSKRSSEIRVAKKA